ncbi:uncharacterized protein LOC132332100 [Haemorhous mexicanus]|uniref:uncharacterized protein LOC132332100 n=1 Tax=Haemorhous mexicanus TaxID=30427 RepID=UPI0028BD7843|nr:uncharacterized protein LOC132332100 [Haemorhous mexicanus]XP_059712045.1 uncharacterized protein LOC132332100 [Haemorhous mexicanus]XP_059712046.1 uncharacterized protein LOC132332100 [Haemorhous mexicanus]XP_059712047.1 uncharacterized protein LOC132332100 [Haemorhous mexicanus]
MAIVPQLILMIIITVIGKTQGLHNTDQRTNMWVTWANQTGQESICLSLATPSDPFCTCLIGVPLDSMEEFGPWTKATVHKNLNDAWLRWCTVQRWNIQGGPTSANWCDTFGTSVNPLGAEAFTIAQGLDITGTEPQELDIPGSMPGNYCLFFGYYSVGSDLFSIKEGRPKNDSTWISPGSSWYYNTTDYCNNCIRPLPTEQGAAKMLPPGVLLICGERAWPAVPQKALGGPCYFGKLTLFAPNIHQVFNISHKSQWSRRSVHQLGPERRDEVQLWDSPSVILASFFTPGVASAHGLTQLRRLASHPQC